ncbi:hypothetical protein L6164_013340 [Bauhinia variegata]|uniref:Uncharacterized protein n=1 Tax=Bauhinia variegata TaxID=167791 RepID=A0ACB9PBR7_BAUVA|nr:hypothetical protein L6164_013340 [Bauhinia variegata]
MGQESDSKSQLVSEICSISTRSVLCVHRFIPNPENAPFIDWYCILGVEENAGIDSIRKRYHKLALQLHPDKNKHPKAEIAFKLVSEAYTCLSDNIKKRAFDLERQKHFCYECNKIPYTSCGVPSTSNIGLNFKAWNIISRARSYKIWNNIKDVRERFKEEAKVIENCLRAYSMSRKESPVFNATGYLQRSKSQQRVEKEIPVFNPSDYTYKGYPHIRNHACKNSETYWYLQTGNIVANEKGGPRDGSPFSEVRSNLGCQTRESTPKLVQVYVSRVGNRVNSHGNSFLIQQEI